MNSFTVSYWKYDNTSMYMMYENNAEPKSAFRKCVAM